MESEEVNQVKKSKLWIILFAFGMLSFIAAIILFVLTITKPKEELSTLNFPSLPSTKAEDTKKYSILTGLEISDESLNSSPVFCMQTPNGLDGGRPQAGIDEAAVIFEAIAEAGITRFAAIYQNPQSAIFGPVRSLRIYYLNWDTPFDCTITHAGGAYDALVAVRNGGYKDLTENYTYMYRGTIGTRRWNNLFTTSTYLRQFAENNGYNTSNPKGFLRLTPEQANNQRIETNASNKLDILAASTASTETFAAKVSDISFRFGYMDSFNPKYHYNESTNSYDRSYANGDSHDYYKCPTEDLGEKNPEAVCELKQLSPSVVIAMIVQEGLASDNYHEAIETMGAGEAHIFQNGTAIKGTWKKASKEEQIQFFDESGKEIALIPGQVLISAIPQYGSVEY